MVYVLFLSLSSFIFPIFVKVTLNEDAKIEFLRFESMKEESGMGLDGREENEKRVPWERGNGPFYEPVEADEGVNVISRENQFSKHSLHLSSNNYLTIDGNRIIHDGRDHMDTCIINREMKTVLSSLLSSSFSLHHRVSIDCMNHSLLFSSLLISSLHFTSLSLQEIKDKEDDRKPSFDLSHYLPLLSILFISLSLFSLHQAVE